MNSCKLRNLEFSPDFRAANDTGRHDASTPLPGFPPLNFDAVTFIRPWSCAGSKASEIRGRSTGILSKPQAP